MHVWHFICVWHFRSSFLMFYCLTDMHTGAQTQAMIVSVISVISRKVSLASSCSLPSALPSFPAFAAPLLKPSRQSLCLPLFNYLHTYCNSCSWHSDSWAHLQPISYENYSKYCDTLHIYGEVLMHTLKQKQLWFSSSSSLVLGGYVLWA